LLQYKRGNPQDQMKKTGQRQNLASMDNKLNRRYLIAQKYGDKELKIQTISNIDYVR
jgi:hypothetical protein